LTLAAPKLNAHLPQKQFGFAAGGAGASPHAPDQLASTLAGFRFRFGDERELQDGIAQALTVRGIPFERERALSRPDRPDFMVSGGTAIEVKVKGSLAELLRQISRYASHAEVTSVLAVGSPSWLTRLPSSICGKPVHALRLIGSLL